MKKLCLEVEASEIFAHLQVFNASLTPLFSVWLLFLPLELLSSKLLSHPGLQTETYQGP